MSICLPKTVSDKLKEAMKSGELPIAKLYGMTSEERNTMFSHYVGADFAKTVNAEFEKAMISNQKNALKKWVEKTFNPKQVEAKNRVLEKINKLDGLLDPKEGEDFLKDLVSTKLGIDITKEEAKTISEKTKQLQKTADEKTASGNHTLEYYKALSDMQKYVQSLNEKSTIDQITSTMGKFMLTSLHTPIKVLDMSAINTAIEEMVKSVAYGLHGTLIGDNPKMAFDYAKEAMEVYQKTGFNLGSMRSLEEGNMFGDNFKHSEGTSKGVKGAIRKVAKATDRVAIHYLHGLTFTGTFNAAFASTVDHESTRIAKEEGLTGDARKARAAELAKEAMTVGTTDEKGKEIRAKAQEDGMYVTNTNSTWGGMVGGKIRDALNAVEIEGFKLRLGDLFIPFAKIPGNIITNSIKLAGVDFVRGAIQFKQDWQNYKETGKGNFTKSTRTLVRAIGAFGLAALIASQVKKDGWDSQKGMIKVGNYWVSTELFWLIGPVLTGMLDAKFPALDAKTGKPKDSRAYNFVRGVGKGLLNLPGLNEILGIVNYGAASEAKNFFGSRIKPAILTDVNKILKGANAFTQLTFGAKVKTDEQKKIEEQTKAWVASTNKTAPGLIQAIANYAKAFRYEPVQAFSDALQGNTIAKLNDGTIILLRDDLAEALGKQKLFDQAQKDGKITHIGKISDYTLDHVQSLELGGDNLVGNFQIIPKTQAAADDQIENYLGKALSNGKITRAQAKEYELAYKKGADAESTLNPERFNSVPKSMTFDEIKSVVGQ